MPEVFVDRDESMAELADLVRSVAGGNGGALVVGGDSGMGKSSLLAEFARRGSCDTELPACRYVQVRCRPGIGPGNTYGPVLEGLLALRPLPEPEPWWRRMGGLVGRGTVQAAPDILSQLVPALAPVIAAGRGLTDTALNSGSVPGDSLLPYQQVVAVQIAETLLQESRKGTPVMVLLDDIQHIDLSSLHVLEKLLQSLSGERMGLVLGHSNYGAKGGGNAPAVDELLSSWKQAGLLSWHQLPVLPQEAVAELVEMRFPDAAVPATLPARLSDATGGHPVFVEQCLQLWKPADGENVTFPRSLPRAVQERFDRLDAPSRDLLFTGAAQGESFLTRAVAEAAGMPHREAMERFRRIASEHGLIRPLESRPDWVRHAGSDAYDFAHRALQSTILSGQTPAQKQDRHALLAAALKSLAGGATGDDVPFQLRLSIAAQLRHGGAECLAESADAHLSLARAAAVDGLSFAEAEQHCEVAIEAARSLPLSVPGRDRRLVEAVELLLSLTEVRWRGHASPGGGQHIDTLAQEAEEAARRLGDRALVARTALLRGKTLLVTDGLEPSLEKLQEAVERAHDCGVEGKVALFIAMVEYGRQLPKRDLLGGLRVLTQAEELYASDPLLGASGDPVLQHSRNLNEMQLGVNLFDAGHLGEARTRLVRCTDRLRDEPLRAELPIALNYLAQLHIATGEEEEAASVLREALGFEEDRGGDSGWHAYNAALLARLLPGEPARHPAAGLSLIEEAWAETERTWLANLVPIVRNLHAEVLQQAAGDDREGLEHAHRLAEATCVETRTTGMVRSEIAAYSLRGRIRLQQGDTAAAVSHARQAVTILDEVGDMPALRTEEVHYYAALAVRAGGAAEEAAGWLERARDEVRRKAGLIDEEARRQRFLMAVPLNRAILGEAGDGVGTTG